MQNKQQQELVGGLQQLLFAEAKGKFGEVNAEKLEFFDEVVGSNASVNTVSELNANAYLQQSEIASSSLNLPVLQRFSCPFAFERSQLQSTTFTEQDFESAKRQHKRQCDMYAAEFAAKFNGLRACPLLTQDFEAYREQYFKDIQELIGEEELIRWNSLQKGWEVHEVGDFGYFGESFSKQKSIDHVEEADLQLPRERAAFFYNANCNVEALEEFAKCPIQVLSQHELIMYFGALASENYHSDLDALMKMVAFDSLKVFFSAFIRKKYYECLVVAREHFSEQPNLEACILSLLQRYEEALVCIERAIQMQPSNLKWQTNKAIILLKLERESEADELLQKIQRLLPPECAHSIDHLLNRRRFSNVFVDSMENEQKEMDLASANGITTE